MAKVEYDGIEFDSQLEVDYYKYLCKLKADNFEIIDFEYHPKIPIQITKKNSYTPDFVVFYFDTIEIIETKGYNPYSKMKDDVTHQIMLQKSEQELRDWVYENYHSKIRYNFYSFKIKYRKIKDLQAYGFVDWDFKNPNTLANKRKEKILSQKDEIKELKEFKKNAERYFTYYVKLKNMGKLTKAQREWYINYEKELNSKYGV